MTEKPLINRVANSGLTTLDLEDFFPAKEMVHFDIAPHLFKGLILKEKDFRIALKSHNWQQYQDKILLVYCTADAIIPVWAYMLIASYATPFVSEIFQGQRDAYLTAYYAQLFRAMDFSSYKEAKVVVKGCGDKNVPAGVYLTLTKYLQPVCQKIMYGEPCSTVPIYKR